MAAGEALAANVAKNGLTQSNKAKGAVNVPGNIVIQRAYTFTNYAGRFLYLEAHNKLHGDSTGPAMSFTYTSPNGTSQVYNLSNSTISPDGNDSGVGGNKISDGDAGAGARYMYHRGLVALQGANASLQARRHLRPRRRRQRQLRHRRRHRVGQQGTSAAGHGVPEGLHHEVHGSNRDLQPDGLARHAVPRPHPVDQPAREDGRLRPPRDGDDGRHHRRQRHPERDPDARCGLPDVQGTR
jgi:hypothetical protein